MRDVYGWLLGRFNVAGWSQVRLLAPIAIVSIGAIVAAGRRLDVLALGDDEAAALGIDPVRVRRWVILAATLGTAAAVAVSGLIGFVGIIVPHALRLLTGPSYRRILPLSAICGAGFLCLADLVARTRAGAGRDPDRRRHRHRRRPVVPADPAHEAAMRPAVYGAGITVDLGRHRILDGVDLTVGNGDWVTVIGPNGAGKSTLLRAIAGLVPAGGRIELFGTDLATMSRRERARRVAVVPQRAHLPEGMTVEHYVLLGRTPHLAPLGAERDEDLAIAADAIATLELDALAHRRLDTLSGGERQRAVLARAIAQEPSLLLLDEPTTALDIGHQQDVLELVDGLRRDRGLTVLATMHDLTLAAQFGEHLVLVADGRVVASGAPIQVLTGPDVARHYRATVDVIRHRDALVVVPLRARPAPTATTNGGRTRCPNVNPTTSRPTTRGPTSCAGRRRSCSSTPAPARARRRPRWVS